MGFLRLSAAYSSFPQALLLMTGRTRVPLALLLAPFLVNLISLSWGWAFLDVPWCYGGDGMPLTPPVMGEHPGPLQLCPE